MKRNSERKRKYEKPAMQVYELQHRTMILVGSERVRGTNSINDWGNGGTDEEDIYM